MSFLAELAVNMIMRIIPNKDIVLVSESNVDLNLSAEQQNKWDYICDNKGELYLLAAMAHKFSTNHRQEFSRFLQDVFLNTIKDVEAGQRLQQSQNKKINSDDIEIDLED